MAKASGSLAAAWLQKHLRPMGWWKACAWKARKRLPMACNGTRNGGTAAIRSTNASCGRSPTPASRIGVRGTGLEIRMTLTRQGFAVVEGLLTVAQCDAIAAQVTSVSTTGVGTRQLLALAWCRSLACDIRGDPRLRDVLPAGYVAAQCTYFEKSTGQNWLVPVHQDLSIPVAARVDALECRGWSEKEGGLFVQPPIVVLEQLVSVRLHLDPCGPEDGPVQVVPGSQ